MKKFKSDKNNYNTIPIALYGDRWYEFYDIVNHKYGSYPYLVGLNAGWFTSFYLVYADSKNYYNEVMDILADERPELIQCDESDYHDDDIFYYGNDCIPVFSDTIRCILPVSKVNMRAKKHNYFEGIYPFDANYNKNDESRWHYKG